MKLILLPCLLFLGGIGVTKAQEQSVSNVNLTDQLKSLCSLTPEQIAQAQPLISDFEKKRDETYKKYAHNPVELKKRVKQNRWDYEISLIGTLNPSQMGLVKVFDQRNPDLMAHESTHYNDVSYFADNSDSKIETATISAANSANTSDIKPENVSEPIVAKATPESTDADAILTNAIKDFCRLSADQFKQAEPILVDFETKRDSIYKLYRTDKVTLNKEVRKNRLNYEVAMVTILAPEQMRVLRAFNLSNRQLMSGSGTTVNAIEFIPNVASISDDKHPVIKPMDATSAKGIQISESSDKIAGAKNNSVEEISLTDELKDLCNLSPEQVAKVEPIITEFETKRDETYQKYHHNPVELAKAVKQNRWDYEVSLIGILNPSQMGLLKVFDQRNPELMTFNSSKVVDVSYFADSK